MNLAKCALLATAFGAAVLCLSSPAHAQAPLSGKTSTTSSLRGEAPGPKPLLLGGLLGGDGIGVGANAGGQGLLLCTNASLLGGLLGIGTPGGLLDLHLLNSCQVGGGGGGGYVVSAGR